MGRITRGLKHMWSAFTPPVSSTEVRPGQYGAMYGGGATMPHTVRIRVSNERSIISSIYSRIAVDTSTAEFKHVRADDQGRYKEDIKSGLNDCLTASPNIDQTPQSFLRDYVLTLLDKGVAAIVPVETTVDPKASGSWDVGQLRVGEITAWYPRHVKVTVYNDAPDKGIREEITIDKRFVGIVQNPFYTIMNEPNSTLQRLIQKLNLLDAVDQQSASGKLDMIIQLPYVIKSEARRQQAEQRRADIEFQLKGSKYGIAYTDGTEKITQLNRPVTNNLMEQITYLMGVLYDQLGVTREILNGTADEKTMLSYNNRVIKPFLDALQEELIKKFLTKTARTQGQTIMYFRNPFEFMPLTEFHELADVLSRNEIASPNELRQVIGWKPSADPSADQLHNSNMPGEGEAPAEGAPSPDGTNAALDEISRAIDEAFAEFDEVPDAEVS
jgi:hypothetical protein